jgi:hypothetical protein
MKERGHLFRIAAEAARDLGFEMRVVAGDADPLWLRDAQVPPPHIIPFYKALDEAYQKAFHPSKNEIINLHLGTELIKKVLFSELGTAKFEMATANADAVWRFGVGLRRVGDLLDMYPQQFTLGEARKLRAGDSGTLPDVALHYIVAACDEYGIGLREAARRIVGLGIDLDAEVWVPAPKFHGAIQEEEVLRVEDRLKKSNRRRRRSPKRSPGTKRS